MNIAFFQHGKAVSGAESASNTRERESLIQLPDKLGFIGDGDIAFACSNQFLVVFRAGRAH